MADLNPKPEEVADKVPELREKFKDQFAEKIKNGAYDQRDIDRLNTDEAYARNFMRTLKSKGDVTKALGVIDEAFLFRKEYGVNDAKESDFPADILTRKAMYYQGKDKSGFPILYINVKENTATGDQVPILKRYIAWNFECHYKENPEQMCVVLMDMSGAGTTNVNIDITKFVIACFTHYFPAFLAYMINYEMPFLLSATWKIISAFLTAEQKKKLLQVSKKDITKYLDEEHLWPHMK